MSPPPGAAEEGAHQRRGRAENSSNNQGNYNLNIYIYMGNL